jgi:hypothetical protein
VVTDDDDDDDDDDDIISGSRRQFANIMFGARLTKTAEMDVAMVLVEWRAYNNIDIPIAICK